MSATGPANLGLGGAPAGAIEQGVGVYIDFGLGLWLDNNYTRTGPNQKKHSSVCEL